MRQNPILHARYCEKERDRNKIRKANKQLKNISDLTRREKKERRKRRAEYMRNYRLKQKLQRNNVNAEVELENTHPLETNRILSLKLNAVKRKTTCYKKNTELKIENKRLRKSLESEKKKCTRLCTKLNYKNLSPGSKLKKDLSESGLRKSTQEQLVSIVL